MKQLIENVISQYCQKLTGCTAEPAKYALTGGGHRIRPLLTLLWCEACGEELSCALQAALSVELIHTMSLIHDDLPCMDNADIRRGKPSCHKRYGEALAVLTGDVLLADALRLVSDYPEAVSTLATAMRKMGDGQGAELIGDSRWDIIHAGKTGSLLSAACELGVIIANGDETMRTAAKAYGESLGLAYQYRDDLCDNDGSVIALGRDRVQELQSYYLGRCMAAAPNIRLQQLAEDFLS